MLRLTLLLGITVGLFLLAALLLHESYPVGGNHPTLRHLVETPSPLEILVHCPTPSDHFQPPEDWASAGAPHPIPVLVQIRNISQRTVVLPHFLLWKPGIDYISTFSTSLFTRRSKTYQALIGQIDWVLLKPGQRITAFDDVANNLTFLAGGTYHLTYRVMIDYCYQKNNAGPTEELSLGKAYPDGDFTTMNCGPLAVTVAPDQVSSR